MKFKSNIELQAGLKDNNDTPGTPGQVLSSTGSAGGVEWIDQSALTDVQSNFVYFDVKNETGSTINKGKGVMAVGTDGNSGHILIDEMVADGSVEPKYFLGVLETTVANGGFARVISFGQLDQFDTRGQNGETWNDGDILWCDPDSAGDFTITEPDGPNVKIAAAIVLNAATNGKIQVRVQANEGIHDLHDTKIVNQVDGDILVWDNTTGVWFNDSTFNVDQGVGVDITGNLDVSGSGTFGDDITIPNNTSVIASNSTGSETSQVIGTTGSNGIVIGQSAHWNSTNIYSGGVGYTLEMDSSKNSTFNGDLDISGDVEISGETSLEGELHLGWNNKVVLGVSPYEFTISRTTSGILRTTFGDTYDSGSAETAFVMRQGSANEVTNLLMKGDGSSTFGGNVTSSGYIKVGDWNGVGNSIRVGDGNDLYIYHDGSDNWIQSNNDSSMVHYMTSTTKKHSFYVGATERFKVENTLVTSKVNLQVIGSSGGQGEIYISDVDNGTSGSLSLLLTQSGANSYIYNRNSGGVLNLGTNDDADMVQVLSTGKLNARFGLNVQTIDADRRVTFKAPNGEERFSFYTGGTGNDPYLQMYGSDGATIRAQINSNGNSFLTGNLSVYHISDGSNAKLLNYGIEFDRTDNYLTPVTNGDKNLYLGSTSSGVLDWHDIRLFADNQILMDVGSGTIAMKSDSDAPLRIYGGNDEWSGIGFQGTTGTSGYIYHNSSSQYFQFTDNVDFLNGIDVTGTAAFGGVVNMPNSSRIKGSSTGDTNAAWLGFYESNGTVRQGFVGVGSITNKDISIYNDTSAGVFSALDSGGFYFNQKVTSNVDFRAPIFYDSNNTGYYLDPASTSILNHGKFISTLSFGGFSAGTRGTIFEGYSTNSVVRTDSARLDFYMGKTTTGVGTMMSLTDTGRVGIGTTSPSSKLNISSASFNDHITLTRSSDELGISVSAGQLMFEGGVSPFNNNDSDLGRSDKHWREAFLYSLRSGGALQFKTSGNNERMRIDSSGNVGIGTTSPGEKLTVSGNISATGTITGSNLSGTNTGDQDLSGYALTSHSHTPESIGAARFVNNAYLNSSTTTADFITELTNDYGCFNNSQVTIKCAWSYAGNSDLNTGHPTIGTIELAGCTIETWGGTYKHVRITRPNTGTGGHGVYEYNDQGSGYSPGWREIWTSESDGAGSGLDADLLDGQHASAFAPVSHTHTWANINGETSNSVNSWGGLRHQTNDGYIDFGPANSGHAHIYTDRPEFYLNKAITVNGQSIINTGDIRSSIFYDSNNTGYYLNPASTSVLNALTVGGNNVLTEGENTVVRRRGIITSQDWNTYIDGTEAGWYQVNNMTGSNKPPAYAYGTQLNFSTGWANKLQIYAPDNGTDGNGIWIRTGWNAGYDTWREIPMYGVNPYSGGNLRASVFYDSDNTAYYLNPASTSNLNIITAAGTMTATNFILSSDKRKKTKIKDLSCDNIDINWKSFEMKSDEGEYRVGVIAQELEIKHPEFVNTDNQGFKSVKYIDLLIAKIAELEARLEKAGL